MTIGELAKSAGVSVETVRYYEREGLLPPAHRWRDNNYRDFDDDAVTRLRFIRSGKDVGFTLREINLLMELSLVPGEACEDVETMLAEKLADVDRRLHEMHRLRGNLTRMYTSCRNSGQDGACPVLWQLSPE